MSRIIISEIQQALVYSSDEATRNSSQRFFKETIRCHGVKAAVTVRIGKEHYQVVRDKSKAEVFDLCEKLWQTGYLEEAGIACNWSYHLHKQYKPEDFIVFERWVDRYVTNWATCDTLCNHTVGTLVEMYPELITELKRWAGLSNRWMKRAAAVSLIVPARHGKFLPDVFDIANILLLDRDDMVQKGYGWMLKAASQAHQQEVFNYVMRNKTVMPRTALRYAIEKMPQDFKKKAMEK